MKTIRSKIKLNRLIRREYLRRFINGGAKGREYSIASLKSEYRQYKKYNHPLTPTE